MLKQKYFNGRISDGGVLRNSPLPKALSGNAFGIPNARYAEPGLCCWWCISTEKNHIIKPHALRNLTIHQWVFNYHHSRARRMVKNAFGILTIRFRVIFASNTAFFWEYRKNILASCVLHNVQVTFSLYTITKC